MQDKQVGMPKPVRRIVTGHDESGRSTVLSDGPAPNVRHSAYSDKYLTTLIWVTEGAPASNAASRDEAPADRVLPSANPFRGGTVFRITDIPPDRQLDPAKVDLSKSGFHLPSGGKSRHFLSHRTDTLDYALVLEGEIWAVLDDGDVHLSAGDVLVQRGTMHAWSNRSDKVCRMAFVMIDAEPLDFSTDFNAT